MLILPFFLVFAILKLHFEAIEVLLESVTVDRDFVECLEYQPHKRLTASSHWVILCSYDLRTNGRGWNTQSIFLSDLRSSFVFHIPEVNEIFLRQKKLRNCKQSVHRLNRFSPSKLRLLNVTFTKERDPLSNCDESI